MHSHIFYIICLIFYLISLILFIFNISHCCCIKNNTYCYSCCCFLHSTGTTTCFHPLIFPLYAFPNSARPCHSPHATGEGHNISHVITISAFILCPAVLFMPFCCIFHLATGRLLLASFFIGFCFYFVLYFVCRNCMPTAASVDRLGV